MMTALWQLSNLVPPVASEAPAGPEKIGFIVLANILGPVIVLLALSTFGHPRVLRVPGLFFGGLILIITALVLSFAFFSAVLKLVVPQ